MTIDLEHPKDDTPTEKPLVSFLKHLIPQLIRQKGKVQGNGTTAMPYYGDAHAEQRRLVSLEQSPLLETLDFVKYIPAVSRKKYDEKVELGTFRLFTPTRGSRSVILGSESGLEFLGYVIKGLYGAFPFIERRKVYLALRDRALIINLTLPTYTGHIAPTWLSSRIETFNSSTSYFAATATPTLYSTAEGVTNGAWLVRIICSTRGMREGAPTHPLRRAHPANKGYLLSGAIIRQLNGVYYSGAGSDPVHLNPYLIHDFEQVFTFLKSLLEYIPCKKAP